MTPLALDANALVQLLLIGLVTFVWRQINGRLQRLEHSSRRNGERLVRIETKLGVPEFNGDLEGG